MPSGEVPVHDGSSAQGGASGGEGGLEPVAVHVPHVTAQAERWLLVPSTDTSGSHDDRPFAEMNCATSVQPMLTPSGAVPTQEGSSAHAVAVATGQVAAHKSHQATGWAPPEGMAARARA